MSTQHVAEVLVRALASHPESVVVNASSDGEQLQLEIHVDPTDVGRVIGRQGRTINAVRTIVKAAGLKTHQFVRLDLIAPDEKPGSRAEAEETTIEEVTVE